MAARLARAKATLEIFGEGDDPHVPRRLEGISITVRNDIATVRLGSEVLLERPGVARVTSAGRRSWQLQFTDPSSEGDVWKVTDERRSCCGRR